MMEFPLCRFAVGENLYMSNASTFRGANSFLGDKRFEFNSLFQRTSRPREIRAEKLQVQARKWFSFPSNEGTRNSISDACSGWLKSFNFPLLVVSGITSIYFFSFDLSSEAHGNQTPPFGSVACEDVSNYYSHAEKKDGKTLKKHLYSIISTHHQSLSYKEVWEALKILDAADVDNPYASPDIIEIYSLRTASKSVAGKPDGWNREHLWPRSYGLTHGPSLSDLHNIRPADVNVNSSRGNKYFGECLKKIECVKPANKEAAFDTETDKERWAPPIKVRGDIARAIMYMAVRYGFHQVGGSPILRLSDSPSFKNREMGLLSTLLKWNRLDPPSRAEKLRNERVCRLYQHNRNPFIDHPEYADFIWNQSSMVGETGFQCKNRGGDQTEEVLGLQKRRNSTSKVIGKHNNQCLDK